MKTIISIAVSAGIALAAVAIANRFPVTRQLLNG
jgi:hypothetical protein